MTGGTPHRRKRRHKTQVKIASIADSPAKIGDDAAAETGDGSDDDVLHLHQQRGGHGLHGGNSRRGSHESRDSAADGVTEEVRTLSIDEILAEIGAGRAVATPPPSPPQAQAQAQAQAGPQEDDDPDRRDPTPPAGADPDLRLQPDAVSKGQTPPHDDDKVVMSTPLKPGDDAVVEEHPLDAVATPGRPSDPGTGSDAGGVAGRSASPRDDAQLGGEDHMAKIERLKEEGGVQWLRVLDGVEVLGGDNDAAAGNAGSSVGTGRDRSGSTYSAASDAGTGGRDHHHPNDHADDGSAGTGPAGGSGANGSRAATMDRPLSGVISPVTTTMSSTGVGGGGEHIHMHAARSGSSTGRFSDMDDSMDMRKPSADTQGGGGGSSAGLSEDVGPLHHGQHRHHHEPLPDAPSHEYFIETLNTLGLAERRMVSVIPPFIYELDPVTGVETVRRSMRQLRRVRGARYVGFFFGGGVFWMIDQLTRKRKKKN
jgi:hypothetical protein